MSIYRDRGYIGRDFDVHADFRRPQYTLHLGAVGDLVFVAGVPLLEELQKLQEEVRELKLLLEQRS